MELETIDHNLTEENLTVKLPKRESFDHTLIADKHFFGGYFNLAYNNIVGVSDAFRRRFNIDINNLDKPLTINEAFDNNLPYFDFEERVGFLNQYFPVVNYLFLPVRDESNYPKNETERRDNFKKDFKRLIKLIEGLRNFYTHFYHKPIDIEETDFKLLDRIFKSVVVEVRNNRKKNDNTKQLLKKSLSEELCVLRELYKTKNQNRAINNDIDEKIIKDAFKHLLFKDNQSRDEVVSKYYQSKIETTTENKIRISRSGVLFLLGMFLNKKESEELRGKSIGFKAKIVFNQEIEVSNKNNNIKFMATHWVFSYLAHKPLKQSLNTAFDKETLLLQIMDELSKVPDLLYDTFDESNKKEFLEDINEYVKEGNDTESSEKTWVVHPVIRKRYEDKFHYFVIRYLDEFAGFTRLKFQVHLGNYIHDIQNDKQIEGTSTLFNRVIKERINIFGTLSKITKHKDDFFKNKDANSSSWEMYPNPSYNFVGNNIPIYITPGNQDRTVAKYNKEFNLLNQIRTEANREQRKSDKKSKNDIVRDIIPESENDIYVSVPTAILSLNELLPMLYALLIEGKTAIDIENILIKKIAERYNLIKNLDENNNTSLSTSTIPKKLKKSNQNTSIDLEKLLEAINREIEICDDKLNLIDEKVDDFKKKKSKFRYVFSEKDAGKEAVWLANDIKRLMPKEVRQNWKSRHHNHLQKTLAYYDTKKDEAWELLSSMWDLDNHETIWSNRLKDNFNETSFDHFYQQYILIRKKNLSGLHGLLSKLKDNPEFMKLLFSSDDIIAERVWGFFNKRIYTIAPVTTQKDRLLAMPLMLPRGIFDEKGTFVKGMKIEDNPEYFANWYRYTYDKNHDYQSFYSMKRDYTMLFEKELKNNSVYEDNKKNISENEQLDLFKMKTDLKIKSIKSQDLFLKLIVDELYKQVFDYEADFSLKDLYLTKAEKDKNLQNADIQSKREKGNKSDNIYKETNIWERLVNFKHPNFEEGINMKLKDLGKFKYFVKDTKVRTLFEYDAEVKWTKDTLQNELVSYENIRREYLLKSIHDFEKYILEKWNFDGINHPSELEFKGNPHFKTYIHKTIAKYNLISTEDIKLIEKESGIKHKNELIQFAVILIQIRNKFAHNEFLPKESYAIIQERFPVDNIPTYSEYFYNVANDIIGILKQKF